MSFKNEGFNFKVKKIIKNNIYNQKVFNLYYKNIDR